MTNNVFNGYGIEIELTDPDNFLVVAETLTRMGISSSKNGNKLYQSCHILHKKRGDKSYYAIMHFKELFALDGKPSNITDLDLARRNSIVQLLTDWKLVSLPGTLDESPKVPYSQIKIIPFKEKGNWELVPKYQIGNTR